jgi:hypothetical protein
VPTGGGRGEPAGGRRAIGEERRGDARQVKQNSDFRPPIGFPNMITEKLFIFISVCAVASFRSSQLQTLIEL